MVQQTQYVASKYLEQTFEKKVTWNWYEVFIELGPIGPYIFLLNI